MSIGTATVAMILNGLGWSLRRSYLVPQFIANKPTELLPGPGITAEILNDDCLGHTLDWFYENDPTTLFAGIAQQARKVFGIQARVCRYHVVFGERGLHWSQGSWRTRCDRDCHHVQLFERSSC